MGFHVALFSQLDALVGTALMKLLGIVELGRVLGVNRSGSASPQCLADSLEQGSHGIAGINGCKLGIETNQRDL